MVWTICEEKRTVSVLVLSLDMFMSPCVALRHSPIEITIRDMVMAKVP